MSGRAIARPQPSAAPAPTPLPARHRRLHPALSTHACALARCAAFQENVGRQGAESFPDGISIVTAADYFTLGNRAHAFVRVAPLVAAFPSYKCVVAAASATALRGCGPLRAAHVHPRHTHPKHCTYTHTRSLVRCRLPFMSHLLTVKLRHYDRGVRDLAAASLAAMVALAPSWVMGVALPALLAAVTSPDLATRHGATAGLAEVILALARLPVALPPGVGDEVRNAVVRMEKARAYTGRGGEVSSGGRGGATPCGQGEAGGPVFGATPTRVRGALRTPNPPWASSPRSDPAPVPPILCPAPPLQIVRAAVCRLVEAQCLAGHPLPRKAALRLLTTVDDCMRHPNVASQMPALSALRALTAYALATPEPALLERLPLGYVSKLAGEDSPAVRRGIVLSLGALPRSLYTAAAPAAAATTGGAAGATAACPLDAVIAALVDATRMERAVHR